MESIYNKTYKQLINYLATIQEKPFRAKQIYQWLYKKHAMSFYDMSDLSKTLQTKLDETFKIEPLKLVMMQHSNDGTRKYLFELEDKQRIETVLMKYDYGYSICVTSQVGCNMACTFCASGLLKKRRNLTAGEIVAQVMYVQQSLLKDDIRVSHIVVMGTGEPFDNYDHVMDFIKIVNHPLGLEIGARHITVSTCGLVDKIKQYAHEPYQTNLAISLHAPSDEIRDNIMPINKVHNIYDLMSAVDYYIEHTNRRVTFEYILLEGVNDERKHARKLARLIRGKNVYVNLIPYNKVDESGLRTSNKNQIQQFFEELKKERINVTVRKEHGADIDAACGQLRAKQGGEAFEDCKPK